MSRIRMLFGSDNEPNMRFIRLIVQHEDEREEVKM